MNQRRPPRLLLKTLLVTFGMAAGLLLFVFLVVREGVQNQVRRTQAQNLDVSQGILRALEDGHLRELRMQAGSLAENPTLKAAVDTYTVESSLAGSAAAPELLATVQRELDKVARLVGVDAVALDDVSGRTLASAGSNRQQWAGDDTRRIDGAGTGNVALLDAGGRLFRVVRVPLTLDDGATIGWLELGNALDQRYAEALDRISRTRTAILHRGRVVASTLNGPQAAAFERELQRQGMPSGTAVLDNETYAFRETARIESAQVYALSSVDQAVGIIMGRFNLVLGIIAVGALGLALVGSLWLARLLTAPIALLSSAIGERAAQRDLGSPLPLPGTSLEVDSLTDSFNQLIASVASAETRTEDAYAGAIRALAATLDARDPYTAGHSERVSALSVAVGHVMGLPPSEIEVLRLGALLHDIGKIGIPDDVLRKPGKLTDAEFEIITTHPVVGARILSSIPFLQPHLPIVELHHERPDGLGYPKGLRGDEIPLLARIVHVADAYDAITSARAYRAGRSGNDALRELWRCAGTEYHPEIVGALARALPKVAPEVASGAPMTQTAARTAASEALLEVRSA